MELIEKTQRDLIGIDTFERAIVFASLLLRKGLRQGELDTNRLLIFQSFTNQNNVRVLNLTIDVKMPYDSAKFNGTGGDFIEAILPFDDGSINPVYEGDFIPPTINNLGSILSSPIEVDTLEKYLIWAMSSWIFYHKNQFPLQWDINGYLSFLDEARPPNISAKVVLPLNYDKYLETNNLIASVERKISTDDQTTSLVGSTLFGNNFRVGN
jgi:hypothetical protein